MANGRREHGRVGRRNSNRQRRNALEQARVAAATAYQRSRRQAETIRQWEEDRDKLAEALEAWEHPKGRIRSIEQHVMALQSLVHQMTLMASDATEDNDLRTEIS